MKLYQNRFPWNLDWNLLRSFVVIAQERGISKAAETMGRKQPTISNAIARLEAQLGYRLIERNAHHFALTNAGEALYEEALEIFGIVSELPSKIDQNSSALKGHIMLELASHVQSSHFDQCLFHFAQQYPQVTFSVSVSESAEAIARIHHNQASLAIALLGGIPQNLTYELLFEEYFGLYCGVSHPLFDKDNVTKEEMKAAPSVAFQTEADRDSLHQVHAMRARMGIHPNPRAVSSNLGEIRRLIIGGVGIGALPVHVAAADVTQGLLRQLPPFDDLPKIGVYVIANPKRRMNSAEAAFLGALKDMIRTTPILERVYQ